MPGRGRSRESRRGGTGRSSARQGPKRSPAHCTSQTQQQAGTPITADQTQPAAPRCASGGNAGPGTTSSATSGSVIRMPALVAAGP